MHGGGEPSEAKSDAKKGARRKRARARRRTVTILTQEAPLSCLAAVAPRRLVPLGGNVREYGWGRYGGGRPREGEGEGERERERGAPSTEPRSERQVRTLFFCTQGQGCTLEAAVRYVNRLLAAGWVEKSEVRRGIIQVERRGIILAVCGSVCLPAWADPFLRPVPPSESKGCRACPSSGWSALCCGQEAAHVSERP